MVGTPFSLVSVAALIVNLFAFLSSHSTTLPVAGVVFAGPRELELALSSNLIEVRPFEVPETVACARRSLLLGS